MAASLLEELLGLRTNKAPSNPWEATDPTVKRDQHDAANPLVGASAAPTPPQTGDTAGVRELVTEITREALAPYFDKLQASIDARLQIERDYAKRNRNLFESAAIGFGSTAAYVLHAWGHPYMRLFVSSYQTVVIAMPGQPAVNRQLVPGWNNLDYPDETRIYRSGTGTTPLAAIFEASDVSTFTPDAVAVSGYVSLLNAPTATNAAADTALVFTAPVGHWIIQNNTTATLGYDLETAASAGSPQIAAGQMLTSDVPLSQLHLFTTLAQNINGTTAGNIVIRAWQ